MVTSSGARYLCFSEFQVCNLVYDFKFPVCACVRNWLGRCITCRAALYLGWFALLKDSNRVQVL